MINNSAKQTWTLPGTGISEYSTDSISERLLREKQPELPEFSEKNVFDKVRTILNSSEYAPSDYGVSIIEDTARLDGFTGAHPYQLQDACQGAAELMFNIEHMLEDILGVSRVSMQAVSLKQAAFELINVLKAYKKDNKNYRNSIYAGNVPAELRKIISLAGFEVIRKDEINEDTLAVILSEDDINEIKQFASLKKEKDFLLILDADGMDWLPAVTTMSLMGIDAVFFDAASVFAITGVKGDTSCFLFGAGDELSDYLPAPMMDIDEEEQYYFKNDLAKATGKVNTFHGDFAALAKSIGYILSNGFEGLLEISEKAVDKDVK